MNFFNINSIMLILLFSVYHGHIQSSEPENLQKIYTLKKYTQKNSFQHDLANRTIVVGLENKITGNDRFKFVSYSYDYWKRNHESLGWLLNLATLANAIEHDLGLAEFETIENQKISDPNTRKQIADLIREKIEIDKIIKKNALPKTVHDFPYELLTLFQKSFWTMNIENIKKLLKAKLKENYDMVKIEEDFNHFIKGTAHNAAYHNNSSVEMPCVFKDLTINDLQEAAIDSPTSTCSTVGMVEVKVIDGPVAVGQSVKLNALLKTNDHTIEVYIQGSDGTLQVVLK